MRVYRLEHESNAQGPWNCSHYGIAEWYGPNNVPGCPNYEADEFPVPEQDGIKLPEVPWLGFQHGVASAREFVRWFPRTVRRAAARAGYVCAVLDVPEPIGVGKHQVIFERGAAKVERRIPLAKEDPCL